MTATIKASDVRIGDRLRTDAGIELTVTRIDHGLLGRPEYVSFIEDSDVQWIKLPALPDRDIELISRGASEAAV